LRPSTKENPAIEQQNSFLPKADRCVGAPLFDDADADLPRAAGRAKARKAFQKNNVHLLATRQPFKLGGARARSYCYERKNPGIAAGVLHC
jgi:hypothetical protein